MQPDEQGSTVGHYRLGRLLGAGGMGEVYLARDLTLGRDVAIKFITSSRTPDHLRERLLHEAKAVASLDHPGICAVYEVGVAPNGRPFMVMPFVQGETLATRLARTPLPPAEAARIALQIAEALAVAHRRGIIHRDLKPQNVMLTPDGQPKLLDFGIAKVTATVDADATTGTDLSALDSAALIGTPAYMSPEQAQQLPLDPRSDLFSLGAIFFECLAWRRAFEGPGKLEILAKVIAAAPERPSDVRPALGRRYDDVCVRLMAKDPADRFRSADEVVGALRALQPAPDLRGFARTDAGARALGFMRRHRVATIAAGTALVATIVYVAVARPRPAPLSLAARGWYEQGLSALRTGAYYTAVKAFEETIRIQSTYALAYARLAEARLEGDDPGASDALLKMSRYLGDPSRLPEPERLRVSAIQALVDRDVDAAITTYRQLVAISPDDASAWLDLGRAQESAGYYRDARATYDRAVRLDPQQPASHLRLGIAEAAIGQDNAGLEQYAEAERLYGAASNLEGQTEVLIRRGALFDERGKYREARTALEAASHKAAAAGNAFQQVRAQLYLSSVNVTENHPAEAQQIAAAAVEIARTHGLATVAAGGLIDVAIACTYNDRNDDALKALDQADGLIKGRGAQRTTLRSSLQRAAVQLRQTAYAAALASIQDAMEYVKTKRFPQYELTTLSIASRAYIGLDDLTKAREVSLRLLERARELDDPPQVAEASMSLARDATIRGALPSALSFREQAEAIHRDRAPSSIPFDLLNRAELLARLGRFSDAARAIEPVWEGIRKGEATFVQRKPRAMYVDLLNKVVQLKRQDILRALETARFDPKATDASNLLGSAVGAFGRAWIGGFPEVDLTSADTSKLEAAQKRERNYWVAATALKRGEAAAALTTAAADLDLLAKIGNDELLWRQAAVGAIAARRIGDVNEAERLLALASGSLARLKSSFAGDRTTYLNRPDLIDLRKQAGLSD